MNSKLIAPIIIVSSLVLASCGGSSSSGSSSDDDDAGVTYSGSKSPATVSTGNAEDLAIAATGGTTQAIAADAANSANPISPRTGTVNSRLAATLAEELGTLAGSRTRIAYQSLTLCDSGSAELDQNSDGTEGSIAFMNCRITGGSGEELDGTVTFNSTVDGSTLTSLNMRFINFRVSYLGDSETVNMTVSCNGDPLACNVFSDFVGIDGRIYRVEITIVTSISGTSFDVDAIVFDPDHGFFTADASVNYNNCPGGVPETGMLTITGAAATTAIVDFNDCDSFTVTHLSVPTVYFWADIL